LSEVGGVEAILLLERPENRGNSPAMRVNATCLLRPQVHRALGEIFGELIHVGSNTFENKEIFL